MHVFTVRFPYSLFTIILTHKMHGATKMLMTRKQLFSKMMYLTFEIVLTLKCTRRYDPLAFAAEKRYQTHTQSHRAELPS